MPPLRVVLASASPRRRELLTQIGLSTTVHPSGVSELPQPGETARQQARRLATAKGRQVAAALRGDPALVLAADTIVSIDGEALGKPDDEADAEGMLRRLRGASHEVVTGVFLQRTDDGRTLDDLDVTEVRFRSFDEVTLRAYAHCGEPLDKAGAYGIQGRGALLVERIDGSWSNVVGLPIERLPGWMARIGIDLNDLLNWSAP